MKLHEISFKTQLQQIDPTKGLVGHDLSKVLQAHGWQVLGWGAEAGVAEHPHKSYVLKLFPQNSLYQHWLKVIHELQGNPHVPRMGKKVKSIPGTAYAYVTMEKLHHVEQFDLIHTWPQILCLQAQLPLVKSIQVSMNVSWHDEEGLINCNHVQITSAEREVFDHLAQLIEQLGPRRLDLKPSNFMARGATWVLTDPFI